MGLSRRQKIIELLIDTDRPLSVEEMSAILHIDAETIKGDLPRIAEAMERKGYKMEIVPARCKKCGYKFEPSLHIPTKCPRCHSQWLEPPRFRLIKG